VQATAETKASKIVAVTAAPSKTKYARRIVTIPLEDASPDWAQITRSLDASAAKLGPQILNLAPEQVNDALQYRGEFGNDRANLIIGSPFEDVGKTESAGQVHQLAAGATGPSASGSRAFRADSPGVRGASGNAHWFGNGLG